MAGFLSSYPPRLLQLHSGRILCRICCAIPTQLKVCFLLNEKWKDFFFRAFHPILVTLFLVVFGDGVTKILCYSLFIFHFVLPSFPWEKKTSYRKSCNLSDEKPKTKLPKYVMSRADIYQITTVFGMTRSSILITDNLFWSLQNFLCHTNAVCCITCSWHQKTKPQIHSSWSQKSCKFSAFSLEFQKNFSITRTIFSHSRSEQFW